MNTKLSRSLPLLLAVLLLGACGGGGSDEPAVPTAAPTVRDSGATDLASVAASTGGQHWVATASMNVGRVGHTATLLEDGRVFVAGGETRQATWIVTPTAELYDPATGAWTLTGSMTYARGGLSATRLTDGRVLVAGGSTPAQLYDPAAGAWTLTGSMTYARGYHSATRLTDGRVLVAGGSTPEGPTLTAELYDPATGAWTLTGSMNNARGGHTATLLTDGKVLVAGAGSGAGENARTAELYDPATGIWAVTGSMNYARFWGHRATLLTDGTVLVVGGTSSPFLSCLDPPFCFVPVPTATAELYDPATGAWRVTGAMTDARIYHTATLLANGRVLVAGGALGCPQNAFPNPPQLNSAEEYDPVTGTWVARTPMQTGRYNHTATLLNDGRVLIAGGISEMITTVTIEDDGSIFMYCEIGPPTGGAEVYVPASPPADTEPPDTTITSAVDGRGRAIPNGGTTRSNSITFSFAGSDNVGVAGFECSLDGAAFAACASPKTYGGIARGTHTFRVRAVDSNGFRDQSPAALTWTRR